MPAAEASFIFVVGFGLGLGWWGVFSTFIHELFMGCSVDGEQFRFDFGFGAGRGWCVLVGHNGFQLGIDYTRELININARELLLNRFNQRANDVQVLHKPVSLPIQGAVVELPNVLPDEDFVPDLAEVSA